MQEPVIWRRVSTTTREEIDALAAELARSPLADRMSLLDDPRWLAALADNPDKSVRSYALRSDAGLVGCVGFLVHPSTVRLALGEFALFSRPVRRLWGLAAPNIVPGVMHREESSVIGALLETIRSDIDSGEVIFLEAVVEGSASMELFGGPQGKRHGFHVLQNGQLYQHRSARLGGSFDAYLAQLGAKTRADLRSTRKKFIAHVKQDYRTRCFHAPDELEDFVTDAMAVSRKTYQVRQLDAGLQDHDALVRRYQATAALGWFRSYILYAQGVPIAFQVGHLYRGRYHAQEIGYDPEWARQHVGIFLHTEVITDLAECGEKVEWFDFGIGDTQHKQRLSTETVKGGYFYLIPDTWRGNAVAAALRCSNAASSAVGAALDRLGMRARVRKLLRRLGAAR